YPYASLGSRPVISTHQCLPSGVRFINPAVPSVQSLKSPMRYTDFLAGAVSATTAVAPPFPNVTPLAAAAAGSSAVSGSPATNKEKLLSLVCPLAVAFTVNV